MNRRVLMLIPARSGSKRVPMKNFLPVDGKSLVDRALEQALAADIATQIVVSTDRPDLVKPPTGGLYSIHERSAAAATDSASANEVIADVLASYESFDDLIYLQPTSPFRSAEDICKAWLMYLENRFDSLVSVGPVDVALHFALKRDALGQAEFLFPESLKKRSQDLSPLFALNGAIYIAAVQHLQKGRGFIDGRVGTYIMSRESSLDVDTPEDWRRMIQVNS